MGDEEDTDNDVEKTSKQINETVKAIEKLASKGLEYVFAAISFVVFVLAFGAFKIGYIGEFGFAAITLFSLGFAFFAFRTFEKYVDLQAQANVMKFHHNMRLIEMKEKMTEKTDTGDTYDIKR